MKFFIYPDSKETKLVALFYVLIGLVFLIFNVSILTGALRFIGVLCLAFAAFEYYFYHKNSFIDQRSALFTGTIFLIIGLVLLIFPEWLLSLLPIVSGIILIFSSSFRIYESWMFKKFCLRGWGASLIVSLMMLFVGLVLIFDPMESLEMILQLVGLFLLAEGILLAINEFIFHKYTEL